MFIARIFTSQPAVSTPIRPPYWNSYETRPQQRVTSRPSSRRVLFVLGTASAARAHQREITESIEFCGIHCYLPYHISNLTI